MLISQSVTSKKGPLLRQK